MRIFVFQSTTRDDVIGFTADYLGNNLPPEFGPWNRCGDTERAGDDLFNVAGGIAAIQASVMLEGFFLFRTDAHLPHYLLHDLTRDDA